MNRHLVVAAVLMINGSPLFADVAAPPNQQQVAPPAANADEWWSARSAGWIGAIGGTGGGLLGAVFGIMAGFGIARQFVLNSILALTGLGVAILLAGIVALALAQPYHVYYPLLLFGGILALVFGVNYPHLKRRHAELELQKMAAMDS